MRIAFISVRHSKRRLGAKFTRYCNPISLFMECSLSNTNHDNPCNQSRKPSNGIKVISNRFQPPSAIHHTPGKSNGSTLQPALQQNNGSLRTLDSFAIGPKHTESHKSDIPRLTRSLSTHCSFVLSTKEDLEPTLVVSYLNATCGFFFDNTTHVSMIG